LEDSVTRINVYNTPTDEFDRYKGIRMFAGWFDPERSTYIPEPKRWNGNNHVGVSSGLQIGEEGLYRTPGGRWVLRYDARNEYNGSLTFEFITDEQAAAWFLKCNLDDEHETYFGAIEEERGPGKPPIGRVIPIRFTPEGRARLDEYAAAHGLPVAAAVRALVDQVLTGVQQHP
jgi:hypothetical protein